jgi:nitroreductase
MKLNRRSFLKKALTAGSLAAGTGTLLAACSGTRRSDLSDRPLPETTIKQLDKVGHSILYHASLAPSGHNSQPWYVRILNQNEWIIGADPDRRLNAVDPDNREVMLSIGAFAENLSLAAGTFGLKAEMVVTAKSPFDREIIKVKLKNANTVAYPLQRITQRMTAKHGYHPSEIKKEDIQALSEHLNGRLYYFPGGTAHARCIEEGAVENFRNQVQRDEAQREMVRWVRLSDKDAERHRDGLTVEGMEIRGLKGWFVRNFTNPEDFMKPAFRKQSVDQIAKLARQGGGWLVITSEGRTVADLIDCGRRFERMFLSARERNIAIQPMTQYLEEESGLKQIAAEHGQRVIPQFILRIGYLDAYPDPVSLRRPVSWFIRS